MSVSDRRIRAFLVLIVLAAVVVVNYFTTKDVVTHLRTGCVRGGVDKAAYVTIFRTIANADAAAGADLRQLPRERVIRAAEAVALNQSIVQLDLHIPVGAAPMVPLQDRAVVLEGKFDCNQAYPNPSLLP